MKKLILFGLAGLAISCRSGNHFEVGDPMPYVSMITADNSKYNTNQIAGGRYTVIMYFRTDCIHCQKETADIVKAGESLKDINIILLTPKGLGDIKQYVNIFKLDNFANIQVAFDERLDFMKYFRPTNIPYLVIYNGQNKLYRIYEGIVPVDSLRVLNTARL